MTKVALLGAGGKMGVRLATNLARTDFEVAHVEVSPAGQARLKAETGLGCVPQEAALAGAEVVILAVPDTVIGKVAGAVVPQLAPGTMVVVLDAAAPFAGHLPERADITYFVTHPCHPPIWNDEDTPEGRADHFGGVAAKQGVVNALMQGPREHYALGDSIARAIYAPVARSHEVTVRQMAMLEPGLSETVCASLLAVMREALDECVARSGVSHDCARDFLLGHMNILGAVLFNEREGAFSDACNKAIEFGKPMLMRDDWKRVFDWDEVEASIHRIT
ncbi:MULTISPECIES: phosphogluconate dehydrogenase C-terminal domain-containing protein [Paracoccus]|uniref:Semialdehyde dehydrogenase n=1 Tax=Paracoccus haeundaensis TaxID=225362 RepID=A0A5C4R6Y4_9RHOB|nr:MULTISPECIES: phosphogluconate dehydrogenase C-terminal domain-containing protein [Paracoccus]KIX17105.1 semialdehyde dehydrogenase [Paracoccus sp. 228]MBF5078790.1 semialdehyde dehydrogenase [Paracoccus sp. NBH48]TNH39692.1 semialdehyde dehydrogenase [Paracoccus haeundaensis]